MDGQPNICEEVEFPLCPDRVYKEWDGWVDFLGLRKNRGRQTKYASYAEAKALVRQSGIKSSTEWFGFCRSGKKPRNLPTSLVKFYSKRGEWEDWATFLGTDNKSYSRVRSNFWPFEKARQYVRSLHLKSGKEWVIWRRTARPAYIPSNPRRVYKEWISEADWLGLDRTGWGIDKFPRGWKLTNRNQTEDK